ncbi:hypothetical protein KY320_01460 [Candidatus Woesearchaeota archaeon]|nr:hypothetical protein [Candidatus Woesearchaeota archaeon]
MDVTKLLDNNCNIAILGDRHTCKTNLLFWLAKEYRGDRDIIFYAYPRQDIGFKQIYSLEELSLITNSIVFMDELQRHIKFYSKRTSDTFLELLSTMIHNNNTLVFTTPLTQFITKATDGFLDTYIYTRISDLGALKNGSKAKRLLQRHSFIQVTQWSVNLSQGEFMLISDDDKGVYKFPDMKIGKDWIPKKTKKLQKS